MHSLKQAFERVLPTSKLDMIMEQDRENDILALKVVDLRRKRFLNVEQRLAIIEQSNTIKDKIAGTELEIERIKKRYAKLYK
jgi:hypothetical protein